jgi:hypothetical protein
LPVSVLGSVVVVISLAIAGSTNLAYTSYPAINGSPDKLVEQHQSITPCATKGIDAENNGGDIP